MADMASDGVGKPAAVSDGLTEGRRRFGIPGSVKASLRRRHRLPALWYVGPLEEQREFTGDDDREVRLEDRRHA